MNDKRLALLGEMMESNPDDPFLRYAIALEYLNAADFGVAVGKFAELMERHPDYVATYYQYALALVNAGDVEKAVEVLEKGIVVAKDAGERKTANELAMLLEDLED